ncbi:cobaltochelatase subunit CobN, partial [Acinetobacter baumannii]
ADDNPLVEQAKSGRIERIFGSVSGSYGAGGLASAAVADGEVERAALGEAYIASVTHAFSAQGEAQSDGFADRIETAEAYLHTTDL